MGIDGGANKTVGVLLDVNGRLLASHRAAGCAIKGRPGAEALALLAAVGEDLCAQAGVGGDAACFCGIGLNGVDFDDEMPMQRRAIAGALRLPEDRLALVNDGIAALWGATPAPAAAIIQHGSGITTAWRARWGGETPFDNLDAGRIYDIRWEVMAVVARMIDGRVAPTPLKDRVLAHLNLSAEKFAEAVFRRTYDRQRYLSTPRLIFEAYEQGDAGAELLVGRAIDDYAQTAAAMVRRTGRDDADVALGGGTVQPAGPKFWKRLAERIAAAAPKAKVIRPQLEPEYGAAIMAAFAAGQDAAAFYEKALAARAAG